MSRASRRTADAASEAGLATSRASLGPQPDGPVGGAVSGDPLIGDLRRAGLLALLVLHFTDREPSYGNQLIDRIADLTHGALSVNPNTMYPLLRSLESHGLLAGEWEHPERRSRRFYRATPAGAAERARLASELAPRFERIARSIAAIREELF